MEFQVPTAQSILQQLYPLRVFTSAHAANATGLRPRDLTVGLSRLHAAGHVGKVRRGLWAVVPFEDFGQPPHPNPHLVGARLAHDTPYALCYHTALQLHGVAHTPSETVQVGTASPGFKSFDFDDVRYEHRQVPAWVLDRWTTTMRVDGQPITTTNREATFAMCVQEPRWAGGPEEVLQSVVAWPSLDAERVLEFLQMLDKESAFHRVGFVLERFKNRWGVPGKVLRACKHYVEGKSPVYWGTEPRARNAWNKDYQLVFPAALEDLRAA